MAEHVVGEWKQFTFKMATPDDYPKILSHLRKVFYVQEPLNQMSQMGEVEYDIMDQFVLSKLNQNDELSFYVEETKTGKVAGVRVTYKYTKEESMAPATTDGHDTPKIPLKLQKILGFLDMISKKARIFDKYGIDFYAELLMTSVDPEFQRQGLVGEIYNRSLAMLKAKGYPVCKSVFTSPFTRRVAEKLGFEELATVYATDYVDDKGEKVWPAAGPELCGSSMAYRLV